MFDFFSNFNNIYFIISIVFLCFVYETSLFYASKFNLSLKTVISVLLTYLHNQICGDTNQYDFCYQYVKFFRNLNMTMHIDLYNNTYYKHKISYIDWYRRD